MIEIEKLAEQHGFALEYVSERGEIQRSSLAGLTALVEALGNGVEPVSRAEEPSHAVADHHASCFVPDFLQGNRIWGVSCQLYGLRSQRNWGIGDFADLALLASIVGKHGGDFVGISPIHAMFADEPWRCSPYGPSSKRFLNTLHIAPDIEPEFEQIEGPHRETLTELRRIDLVDYGEVATLKYQALRQMHQVFASVGDEGRREAFLAFRARGGEALEQFGLFEALCEYFHKQAGRAVAWQDWPTEYRSPQLPGAVAFRDAYPDQVEYRIWLQWLAEMQMARAQHVALEAGMRVGVYVDLAVGVVGDSAETWIDPHVAIEGASIGAPPDSLNNRGQDWQLAPLSPEALTARNFAPLRAELASSMAHAGAVRLDHAMSLTRLFWVPRGMPPTDGAYMHYPFGAMIGAVAEASHEYRALVIAEALGTVPPGFREGLAAANIHAYQVLPFERQHGGEFMSPMHYHVAGLACVSTHDMPTLRGWWQGKDIGWRQHIGLFLAAEADVERGLRQRDRQLLWAALRRDGLEPPQWEPPEDLDPHMLALIHRFVARGPSRLFAVQMEDALGMVEQANLPGETAPHPNWRRKLPVTLEALSSTFSFVVMAQAMVEERPRR